MKRKKRALTLLEIMIVIFLIGLIGSVIGYNMKGSLNEGKAFRTEEAAARVRDILMLEIARGEASPDQVVGNPKGYLANAGITNDVEKMMTDGWGEPYKVALNNEGDVEVTSAKLIQFKEEKKLKIAKHAK